MIDLDLLNKIPRPDGFMDFTIDGNGLIASVRPHPTMFVLAQAPFTPFAKLVCRGYFVELTAPSGFEAHLTYLRTGWAPIETAPLDGTEVFVWAGGNFRTARYINIPWLQEERQEGRDSFDDDGEACWRLTRDEFADEPIGQLPTHWRPLPSPPEAQ